jgi:hypothetical protein
VVSEIFTTPINTSQHVSHNHIYVVHLVWPVNLGWS